MRRTAGTISTGSGFPTQHAGQADHRLSATPWTSGLRKFYDDLIVASTIAQLIEDGYRSPFLV